MTRKKKIIIAGPCSVKSELELYNTARQIYNYIDIFRCGVWKARTNPKSYKGSGNKTIGWLNSVSKEFNLPIAIEVGLPSHIEIALKHNIKIFWIGARTTVNPFYINEICQAIKGSNVEIWIKNPIHADINAWIGAIERFSQIGIKKIKAIHRGFFNFYESKYRNSPKWHLVDELKIKIPNIDIICDPSHICGNTFLLKSVSKKAINRGLNGLMIETHCQPNKALSDANQQINPQELKKLIKEIY